MQSNIISKDKRQVIQDRVETNSKTIKDNQQKIFDLTNHNSELRHAICSDILRDGILTEIILHELPLPTLQRSIKNAIKRIGD